VTLKGTPCDLVTGEERNYADPKGNASSHVACTVEMTSINTPCKCEITKRNDRKLIDLFNKMKSL
jgi:hypothetical protein